MQFLSALLITAFSLLLSLLCYVNLLYREKGRFLVRGSKDNVDFFEEQVEPQLKIGEEEAERTIPLLLRVNLIILAMLTIGLTLGQPLEWSTLAQTFLFLTLDIMFFAEVIPHALLARTTGRWLLHYTGLLRTAVLLVTPLVAICQFLHHFATLGQVEDVESEEPTASENIEALMIAGEEEGLLEKEDRRLIRSVVEFGDKTVREVMTPRPEIFAVPAETTLGQLKEMLRARRLSRIPVYESDLDHIIGFVHALDLLSLSADELADDTVRKLLRDVTFVPETKSASDLLKEIQQTSQVAMVVDEYGSVAGLVTMEDMIEEIVGEIRNEGEARDVIPHGKRSFSVPGGMRIDRLEELFGVHIEDTGGATTVSGLVTSATGKVPAPGEVIERDGLRFHITESSERRILRLLISAPEENPLVSPESSPETPSLFSGPKTS